MIKNLLDIVHACNHSNSEAEKGESQAWGQLGLQASFSSHCPPFVFGSREKKAPVSLRWRLELLWSCLSDCLVTGDSKMCARILPGQNVTSQVFPSMATTPWESELNLQMNILTGWTSPSALWMTVSPFVFAFCHVSSSCLAFFSTLVSPSTGILWVSTKWMVLSKELRE